MVWLWENSCSHTSKFVDERIRNCLEEKNPKFCKPIEDLNGIRSEWRKKILIDRRVVYVKIVKLFSSKCGKLEEMEYRNITKVVWFCSACYELRERNQHSEKKTLSDICRWDRENCESLSNAANQLQPNLQIAFKKINEKGKLVFLDINLIVDTR